VNCVIVTDVTATMFVHEYFLKVVPTVVDEVGGKGLLYGYQYTYASRVSDYHYCSPPPSPGIFTGWMPFLPFNQQRQSTEGNKPVTQCQ